MKLLIQLVREILPFSGKSQGISKSYDYGNHITMIFPLKLKEVGMWRQFFSWKVESSNL